jgi:hypothetical protein
MRQILLVMLVIVVMAGIVEAAAVNNQASATYKNVNLVAQTAVNSNTYSITVSGSAILILTKIICLYLKVQSMLSL